MLFCVCIALAIPLMVFSTSNQEKQENMIEKGVNMFEELNHHGQQPIHSRIYDDESSDNIHFMLKKAADFEQILKPCNRMPASGRGQEYADCVRSRMLLMGRRKRRQSN
ncbi:unnamed protein product [Adineta steineri]|uniref:Uncharacterized protein n=1 Tax=Adineta steineri TaxID=433720 RepID=A0A813S843_9BILA|nr:unnamed protein product [Adineta steineri]CAF0781507.1 unnamed protein product [Adineta steineri]CAF0792497.1 unnamed protein product [Adineta steineri]CAF0796667.1 unnamed protein product [Adineta steineri]CAF0839948.1 unnamed protein product [Adineta steineri]